MAEDYKTPAGAPPDWRGLCEELTEHLALLDEPPHELVCRAQAALAQPEPEVAGPSDEELLGVAAQTIEPYDEIRLGEYEAENNCCIEVYGSELIAFARAVLARWGRPAPAPAEGEVADETRYLVKELRDQADDLSPSLELFGLIHRAADLLEQRQAAPVPVSERLPGTEDCDAEGRCWWLHVGEDGVGDWFQRRPYPSTTSYTFFRMTHWLPATALPLPAAEVQP